METKEIGSYTCCRYEDGWWITLTATGEKLRGPLVSLYACELAVARYERLTAGLTA